jgi:hypothetical protein
MDKIIDGFRHPAVWGISVQLLLLYVMSVGLFFVVDAGNRSASESLNEGVKSNKALNQLTVLCVAAASTALGVLTFVFLCRKLNTVPRLAMVGLPLVLLIEKRVRAGRADHEHRRLDQLLAAGAAIGIIAAVLVMMSGSPLV